MAPQGGEKLCAEGPAVDHVLGAGAIGASTCRLLLSRKSSQGLKHCIPVCTYVFTCDVVRCGTAPKHMGRLLPQATNTSNQLSSAPSPPSPREGCATPKEKGSTQRCLFAAPTSPGTAARAAAADSSKARATAAGRAQSTPAQLPFTGRRNGQSGGLLRQTRESCRSAPWLQRRRRT